MNSGLPKELIQKIEFLPAPGTAYGKLLQVLGKPESTVNQVLDLIELDVNLTANLLKLCHSPLFPLKRELSSLREAIIYSGFEEIKKMVLLLEAKEVFSTGSAGYESRTGELWNHSIAAAIISTKLIPFAPELKIDLFTACLLHDVGKIVLSEYVSESLDDLQDLIISEGISFIQAEKKLFGMDHAELGAAIFKKWGLPAEMVNGIRYHHQPNHVPDSPETHFITLSDTLSMLLGITTSQDGLSYNAFPSLSKLYKINQKQIEYILLNSVDDILTLTRINV